MGTSVTISGSNFGSSQGTSTVTFGGTPGGTAPTWTATSIVIPVPSGAPVGSDAVVVTVAGVASNSDKTFTVNAPPAPNIASLSPNTGPATTLVTISGTNFGTTQGSSTVTFGGIATNPISWNSTTIVAPVPAGAQTGNVIVTVGGVASNPKMFTVPTGTNVYYYLDDMLGSARVITTSAGAVCYDADFYPFGGERVVTDNCGPEQDYKFQGKERDAETGNDNFGARYYSNRLGRFMSPDWADEADPVPYADENDPQTLNLYAYVRNNPVSKRDDDGHHLECSGTTYGTDKNGNLVVQANCHEVPDFFLCPFCSSATRARLQTQYDQLEVQIALGQIPIYENTLPIGPGDVQALGELENLLQDLKNGLRPAADSPALQKIIDQLFKSTDTLPGGTAGAVRKELETGQAVGGKFHSIKAAERTRQLEKLVNTGTLSAKDSNLARAIMQDLKNALSGK